MIALKALIVLAVVLSAAILALPPVEEPAGMANFPPSAAGPLAEVPEPRAARNRGSTGIAPLRNGADAFEARIILADAAA